MRESKRANPGNFAFYLAVSILLNGSAIASEYGINQESLRSVQAQTALISTTFNRPTMTATNVAISGTINPNVSISAMQPTSKR